jgi:DNA-directed RNA polymerase subunit delta
MDIRKMTKEELEELSYTDIAYYLLKEINKNISIHQLFEQIGELLDLSKKKIEDKIADFYTAISIDKRFIVLDAGMVDLRSRHSIKATVDDLESDEYDDIVDESEEDIDLEEEVEEDYNSISDDDSDYDETEDLKNLLIVDEAELEE